MESGNITTAEGFRSGLRGDLHGRRRAGRRPRRSSRRMLPTGCPGWTVRDHVAHITDLESILDRAAARRPHRPGGAAVHPQPARRRSWRSASMPDAACRCHDLLAEYRDVTKERLARLDGSAGFAARRDGPRASSASPRSARCSPSASSISGRTSRTSAARSASRAGFDGVAAAHSRERMLMGAGNELQERLAPPAGTSLVFDITGPGGALRAITFDGERGRSGDAISRIAHRDAAARPAHTDRAHLRAVDDPAARSRVVVEGDQNLARRRARGPGGHPVKRTTRVAPAWHSRRR